VSGVAVVGGNTVKYVNFLGGRGFKCLGVAIAHNLYRNIVNIDVYTEFELLEVKVPIIFLGTAGFSPPREGCYRVGEISCTYRL